MARTHPTVPAVVRGPAQGGSTTAPPGVLDIGARWWPGLAVAAAGVAVYHGALRYFFAQDDFAGLARASGLLPRLGL